MVNLTGALGPGNTGTGNASQSFALQMSFDPSQINGGSPAAVAAAASNGFIYLGYRDATGQWINATAVNTAAGGPQVYGHNITDGNSGTGVERLSSGAAAGTAPFLDGAEWWHARQLGRVYRLREQLARQQVQLGQSVG